jgi:hypothetical protein
VDVGDGGIAHFLQAGPDAYRHDELVCLPSSSVTTSLDVTFNTDSALPKNRRAASASRRAETSTSMTCPYWSTAR